jgi:multidrug efflux pump subunit AcrA (membrane-fusion protein)
MEFLRSTYIRIGKKRIFITIATAAAVVFVFSGGGEAPVVENVSKKTLVEVATPLSLSGSQSTEIIGSVSARTQADLQSEVGGRITSVNVSLGQTVAAGQVIATFENAAARASVLQAEGAYDAAKVSAAQSDIGVREAEASLADAVRAVAIASNSAYGTTFGVLNNTIDQYFSGPNTAYPGVRVSTGETTLIRNERITLQDTLEQWYEQQNASVPNSTLYANLSFAKGEVERVLKLNDIILQALSAERGDSTLDQSVLESQKAGLTASRVQLIAAKNSLESASSNLKSAEEGLSRSKLASSGGNTSLADAQLKQALGSLRAAQANLAKSIVRTPIAGQVNSLSVKTGDFVGAFSPVAKIANNQGLEITAFIGLAEIELLNIGSELLVENAGTGTVTNISPALDPATGKIEIRIAVSGDKLKNGDSVRVFLNQNTVDTKKAIQLPLSAVKFDGSQGYVFQVVDEKLSVTNIELGAIRGDRVDVVSGIEESSEIVVDARGLAAGAEVTVVTK